MRRGVNKKSIAIIGEGETEWFYFDTLRTTKRYRFKLSPDIPAHPDLGNILRLALKYQREQYDYVVCLIDMDRIKNNSTEWQQYQTARANKQYEGIIFIETYPCTEFWFLLHFLPGIGKRAFATMTI